MRPQTRQVAGGRKNDSSSSEDARDHPHHISTPMTDGKTMKRSTSFKSFLHGKDPSKSPTKSSKSESRKPEEKSLKKSKSSTSLSALFSRPRSSKGAKSEETRPQDDKENESPSDFTHFEQPPPIWAQFATTAVVDTPSTTRIPLNDCNIGQYETKTNAPGSASPSKTRTSREKSLPRRPGITEAMSRPKSEYPELNESSRNPPKLLSGLRRSARHRGGVEPSNEGDRSADQNYQNKIAAEQKHPTEGKKEEFTDGKRTSRVLEAAAFFNQKSQHAKKESVGRPSSAQVDPVAIENAFEALLDTRNVPLATREKMRRLDTTIKADFVRQDKAAPGSASSTEDLTGQKARPNSRKHDQVDTGVSEQMDEHEKTETPRKSRPRSLTFTFNKGDQSPSKRQKSSGHQRARSGEVTPSASSKPSSPAINSSGLSLFGKTDKFALPEQVIGYLRKVQQPQAVEVGKIQKLRQLLRNETVGWVNEFIAQGGMMEIVELLYRTIAIEWRCVCIVGLTNDMADL